MGTLTWSLKNQQGGGPGAGFPSPLLSPRFRRVTDYIQQHLDNDLSLAELAAVVYMSPYHFARLFKCSTGVPPHRFVVQQRIARACAILATPEPSIAQISRMVASGPRATSPRRSAASRASRPRDIEPRL
jgi:AraC family transcriptional regulator